MKTVNQPGEKWHTQTGSVYNVGYRLVPKYQKGTKGKYLLAVSDMGWQKLEQDLKILTRKTTPSGINRTHHQIERRTATG